MPKVGKVVSHSVGHLGHVVCQGQETVVALVQDADAQEVSSWASGGGRSFLLPCHCRDVVIQDVNHVVVAVAVLH